MKPITKKVNIINRTDSLTSYFNELTKMSHPLTPDEETKLINKYQQEGCELSREKVLNSNLRFVVTVANYYHNGNKFLSINDLINEGNIGLIRAIDTFDTSLGFKFISYAVYWIRQRILNYINKDSLIRIPENTLKQSKLNSDIILPKYLSLDHQIGDDKQDTILSLIKNKDSISPDNNFNQLNLEKFLNPLDKKSRLILELRYGLNGNDPMTFREISVYIGISHQRVQQLHTTAIWKLKNIYKNRKNILDGLIYK